MTGVQTCALRSVGPLESEGVAVERFPTPSWPAERPDRWSLSPSLVRWIATRVSDFDLVHIHGVWGLALISGLAAARRRGMPILVTPHESLTAFDIDDSSSSLRRRQKLLLKGLYLRWATILVLASELEADDSMPPEARARVRVIPDPVVDPLRSVPPPGPRGSRSELRIGCLGRIHKKKNIDLLLHALAALPDHVRLVVAGDSYEDLPGRLQNLSATLRVVDRVEWLGFVAPERRGELFAGLDLLAMPSVFESFGMAAAEAMLDGVPALVSDRSGVAEVIRRGGGGVVIPPELPAVIEAIAALDDDRPSLLRLGTEAQAAVRAQLSFPRIGTELKTAYTEALDLAG